MNEYEIRLECLKMAERMTDDGPKAVIEIAKLFFAFACDRPIIIEKAPS